MLLLACVAALAACSFMTPPAISALMGQVVKAVQSHNKSALRACYAQEGVSKRQVDIQTGNWQQYLARDTPWTFTGITYVSLAEARHNKSIFPETIAMMTTGSTIGGYKFAPNIKVEGFILVMFKVADGSEAGVTEPVGIASDGTAKMAVVEPRH